MRKTSILLLTALSVAPSLAEAAGGLSYDYVDLRYDRVDMEDAYRGSEWGLGGPTTWTEDASGDGFGLAASRTLGGRFFLAAEYMRHDVESDADIGLATTDDRVGVTVGRYWPRAATDIVLSGGLIYSDQSLELAGQEVDSASELGYQVAIGVRHMLTDVVEVFGSAGYADVFAGDATVDVGLRVLLSERLSLLASYGHYGERTDYGIALRLGL